MRGSVVDFLLLLFIIMSFPTLVVLLLSRLLLLPLGISPSVVHAAECHDYLDYATTRHGPFSSGRYNMSYQRPAQECRTFKLPAVEETIQKMKSSIKDPDLFRLFENSFPNTLDTAIKWKGTANGTDEDLTFVITGDINAMWLRDSSNQMQSYLSLLKPSSDKNSIASLYRGVINLQARYLIASPYCNSFQPPEESNVPPAGNGAGNGDIVSPDYDSRVVFECKWELDSLAAFLQVSSEYYEATKDVAFFGKYNWIKAIQSVMKVAQDMTTPTYGPDGKVLASPYSWLRSTTRATETLANDGVGNPVAGGTGLIRSAFRPSDDATIYQFFIPSNMMFSRYLSTTAEIMSKLPKQSELANQMKTMSHSLRKAIRTHGTFDHPKYGQIFAYEVDGFGSTTIMDDANIPSLLSAPFLGYLPVNDSIYQNTRKLVLSSSNPYFMRGPAISAVGGPHIGPGQAWPMASIVRILTSDDDVEISKVLKEIVSTTAGLGLIHESVDSWNPQKWTRQW
jgi:meiotically up-regulated gene 157 (Mug157) protein